MKNLSDSFKRLGTASAKKGGLLVESSDGTAIDTVEIADKLNGEPIPSKPELVVADNPKMKKTTELVIGLMNKNCGWKAYCHPFFKTIDGDMTILVLSGLQNRNAITVTPVGKGDGAVVRYYKAYDLKSDEQVADYTIKAKNMGIVRMFDLLFDIIANPDAYKNGLYEGMQVSSESDPLNEGRMNADMTAKEIKSIWNSISKSPKCIEMSKWLRKQNQRPSWFGGKITLEGIYALADYLKDKEFKPFSVAVSLCIGDADGIKYREILTEGEPVKKRNDFDIYCAIVYNICTDPTFGINANVLTNETVNTPDSVTSEIGSEYRGIDISLVNIMYDSFAEFKELVDKYFRQMEDLKKRTQHLVEFCKKSRVEKLNNLDVGAPAVFISGIGGIGKSETWNEIKKEMNLVEGKDYAERDNTTCNAKELYNFIYNNNGRVLVFDDTPKLFDSEFQIGFWKKALEPKGDFPTVKCPTASDMGEGVRGNFYSISSCIEGGVVNYKKRYYKECPEIEKKGKKKKDEVPDKDNDDKIKTNVRMIPDRMKIMSRFIIITNMSEEKLSRQLEDSWGAIRGRCKFYRIAPPVLVIWTKVKEKLMKVKDTKDDSWAVPPQYVDEVIETVENEFREGRGEYLTWRAFVNGSLKQSFILGLDWKDDLVSQINKPQE